MSTPFTTAAKAKMQASLTAEAQAEAGERFGARQARNHLYAVSGVSGRKADATADLIALGVIPSPEAEERADA